MADFALLEALLFEPRAGYFLLERHLARLSASARRFGFRLDQSGARERLTQLAAELPREPRKVRLELSSDGSLRVEQAAATPSTPLRVALAAAPVDSQDELLRHKTSRRGVYERALAARPPWAQDVLLWNERGLLTETSSANLVLEIDGRRLTPRADAGLLPGTFRAELLARGEIEEAVIPVETLEQPHHLFLVNSVRRWCALALGALAAIALCGARAQAQALSADDVRAIAKDAYVYGYPMVDNYRILYAYAQDKTSPEYKAPWNTLANVPRVFTPEDKAVQTPNSDTPYSMLAMDLRAEPLVLTLPPIPKERYFSVQLIDLYTFNFAYLGSRTTGNGGGDYLVAGPSWKGEAPPGVKQVIRCETDFALALYRTQLFAPDDLDHVKEVQAGYKVQTLSKYLNQPPPPPAYFINWLAPVPRAQMRSSPQFFAVLLYALQWAPVHPSEKELRARIDKLEALTHEQGAGLVPGMQDGQKEIDARIAGAKSSADSFGTREFLKNDWVARAAAAQMGIYGNSREEALYFPAFADAGRKPLDGAKTKYTVKFAKAKLPPANAFWSLTLYSLPDQLLVANPLQRYLVNSPMLPGLKRDQDGGLTLYLQHDSPGKALESNWLPAPSGPFFTVLRLYWPKPEALSGAWKAPAVRAR